MEAAEELILQNGYSGLTFQNVAAAAKVDRSTLYRRWNNRAELAVEVVSRLTAGRIPTPDTGSFQGDLSALLQSVAALATSRLGFVLLTAGLEVGSGSEEAEIKRAFWKRRPDDFEPIFARAAARGEWNTTDDAEAALAMLAGAVYFRVLVMGQPADQVWLNRVVHQFLAPLERFPSALP